MRTLLLTLSALLLVAVPLVVLGQSNEQVQRDASEITGTDAGTDLTADLEEEGVTCTSCVDFSEQAHVTIGADPASTCTAGDIHIDTDETSDTNCTTTADNAICVCSATDTWVSNQ